MAPRTWNPHRLDVIAFARESETFAGCWPATELPRWCDGHAPEAPPAAWPEVRWQIRGETRKRAGAALEHWLHLRVEAEARLTCQRCLQPVAVPLLIDRAFRFVADERSAAQLDAECEEDVLVASANFDAREWVEDELLLALPIVPLHECCPKPLLAAADAGRREPAEAPRAHPFAALAALRERQGGDKS